MSTGSVAHEIVHPSDMAGALAGPPGAGAPEGAATIGAAEVWRVIKQRKLLVLISFVAFYTAVIGATMAIRRWCPTFSSEAILELEPPRLDPFGIEPSIVPEDVMQRQLETEASKLKQLSLLQQVLAQPEIKATGFYAWYEDDFPKCLYSLQELLKSAPIRDTNLIRVRLDVERADEARLLVNTIVRLYLRQYQEDAQDAVRLKEEDLRDTLANYETDLANRRADIARFRETTDVPTMESELRVLAEGLGLLTSQFNQLDAEAADYEAQLSSMQDLDPRNLPITPEMRIIVEADPILRYRRERVEGMDVELESMVRADLMGPHHRQWAIMEARRDGYYQKEMARREELLDDLRGRQLESLRQNLARIRSVQARLREHIEEKQAERRDVDRNLQRYSTMLEDEERLQEGIKRLEEAVGNAEHARSDRSRVRLKWVQEALEAKEPSRPKYILYLGAGFLLSALGAVGLAFLREFTDKAVRTPIDVARYGPLSVLGCIPLLDDEEADVDEIELATRTAPQSLVAEAFRQVSTNLLFSGPVESQRALLITSPGPEDGKTAVAINLAITLAQSNNKVLLVDCNFRRPAIRAAFAKTRPDGLSNILSGQAKLADLITKTEQPNLDVLTSGPVPPTPAELLGGAYMRALVEEAKQHYDRVIFDGPPVLLVTDALVASKQVDGVIMVTRAVSNTKGALKRAREQFDRIGVRVVGAVLNGVQARPGGYFKQQYRDFYDYISDETIPHQLPGVEPEKPQDLDLPAEDED